jgi:hypothetical protein
MSGKSKRELVEEMCRLSDEEQALAERRHDLLARASAGAPSPTTIQDLAGMLMKAYKRGIDVKRLCEWVASTDMEPAAIARQVYRESKQRRPKADQAAMLALWEAQRGKKSREQRHSKVDFAGMGEDW